MNQRIDIGPVAADERCYDEPGCDEPRCDEPGCIEIFFDDLKEEKQREILEMFGENCNFDVFPIVSLSPNEEMQSMTEQLQ